MNRHIALPIAVSLLAIAFLDPFRILMSNEVAWVLLAVLFIVTSLYGFFVLTEQADDEREVSIRAFADRVSCLAGMTLLVLVICYHLVTNGHVYPEIVITLVAMVVAKSAAYKYACKHH